MTEIRRQSPAGARRLLASVLAVAERAVEAAEIGEDTA